MSTSEWRIEEDELHHLNWVLQKSDEVLLWNCITRTAQESALFPVMPYLMSVFFDAYYRYPDLLREATARISPEACGHRAREVSCKLSKLTAWACLNYYLNGRSLLVSLGLQRPEDNLEDLWFMVQWYERFALAYHRESAHLYVREAGDIAQELPERTLQVLEADAFAAEAHPDLREATKKFLAVLTQYNFLAHAESRTGLHSSGPYALGDNVWLVTRDFFNMAECDLPWMDGVGADVPYNNLTLALVLRDTTAEVTDWGSLFTEPEQVDDRVLGVGLYASDWLTDRYIPVGMDSPADLVEALGSITAVVQKAIGALYKKFASMSWRQMVHAGMVTYFQSPNDVAHMAGTYRQSDWERIDERAERLLALMNEEYARDAYVDKFVAMASFQSAQSEYYVHPVSKTTGRGTFLVPQGVLVDHDYSTRANPSGLTGWSGTCTLPPKEGRYTMLAGRMTETELNRAAEAFDSPLQRAPWVHLDDAWVKHHWTDPEVDALYRFTQERSRLLGGRGAALRRADIERIRGDAGEPAWRELAAAQRGRP